MIYLLLFLAAAAILMYVTSRWLRGELRELRAWLAEKWVVVRGGESQSSLITRAQHAFAAEGLQLDFMVVSRQVIPCHEQLRQRYMGRTAESTLPIAVVLAVAADTRARRLYLRAVTPRPHGPARDTAEFLDFDAVESVQTAGRVLPTDLPPDADQALVFHLHGDRPPHHLHLEAAWSISPQELAQRIRDLVAGQWHPEAPPTIVR